MAISPKAIDTLCLTNYIINRSSLDDNELIVTDNDDWCSN